MKTIHVNTSTGYDVYVGSGICDNIANYVRNLGHVDKVAIVSDSNVFPILGQKISSALSMAGFDVLPIVFRAGEESKNQHTLFQILELLSEDEFTRTDLLIALGGGVTGDITGFAASIYLRGISYFQIPTSLLAMVDSSVGGKTAIDLPAGKNLVGAFYQPALVLCDLDLLQSLPKQIFLDGCAEIIKYGVLFDKELFAHLLEHGPEFDLSYVIPRCIQLKAQTVEADEFDRGLRQKLNLGHTIGHSIEKQSNYTVSHGQAVATGMAVIAKATWNHGLCSREVNDQLCEVLKLFQLPSTTHYSATQLYDSALSDKKRSSNMINLIIPQAIGNCEIFPIATDNLQSFIEAGL